MLLLASVAHAQPALQRVEADDAKLAVRTLGLEGRRDGLPVVIFESGFGQAMEG